MNKKTRLLNLLIIAALFLGACNLPSGSQGEELSLTAAAQTVEALLSATPVVSNTNTPLPIAVTATFTPIPLPVNTNTPVATATSNCNVAQFVDDITYPDNAIVTPGQNFTKTWRLKNIGTCTWTPSYAIVFSTGNAMNGPSSQALTGNVNPGQTIDISVNLTAPASPDTYRGDWKIRDGSGVLFGGFYILIKVQNPAEPTKTFTPVPAAFAVTSVSFEVTGTCPNFHVKVNVTANGAGTVKYKFVSQDNSSTSLTDLVFTSAGTKLIEYDRYFGVNPGSLWTDIYIDDPNHQQFGRATFTCP